MKEKAKSRSKKERRKRKIERKKIQSGFQFLQQLLYKYNYKLKFFSTTRFSSFYKLSCLIIKTVSHKLFFAKVCKAFLASYASLSIIIMACSLDLVPPPIYATP